MKRSELQVGMRVAVASDVDRRSDAVPGTVLDVSAMDRHLERPEPGFHAAMTDGVHVLVETPEGPRDTVVPIRHIVSTWADHEHYLSEQAERDRAEREQLPRRQARSEHNLARLTELLERRAPGYRIPDGLLEVLSAASDASEAGLRDEVYALLNALLGERSFDVGDRDVDDQGEPDGDRAGHAT